MRVNPGKRGLRRGLAKGGYPVKGLVFRFGPATFSSTYRAAGVGQVVLSLANRSLTRHVQAAPTGTGGLTVDHLVRSPLI
jgi:hypothetical protein